MVKDEVVLAVGRCSNVYVGAWVVDVHDVVYYFSCLLVRWHWSGCFQSAVLSFLLVIAVISIISLHIDCVAIDTAACIIQILWLHLKNWLTWSCSIRCSFIVVVFGYIPLYLLREHSQTLVLASCAICKIDVRRIDNHRASTITLTGLRRSKFLGVTQIIRLTSFEINHVRVARESHGMPWA